MKKEPTTEEIPDSGDDRPATNRDVALLRSDVALLQRDVRGLRKDVAAKASKKDVEMASKKLVGLISDVKEEILHHFDAAVENIEEELKGANADEISLLSDARKDHETRITAIEKQVAMR